MAKGGFRGHPYPVSLVDAQKVDVAQIGPGLTGLSEKLGKTYLSDCFLEVQVLAPLYKLWKDFYTSTYDKQVVKSTHDLPLSSSWSFRRNLFS
jgi:hypothetical protein